MLVVEESWPVQWCSLNWQLTNNKICKNKKQKTKQKQILQNFADLSDIFNLALIVHYIFILLSFAQNQQCTESIIRNGTSSTKYLHDWTQSLHKSHMFWFIFCELFVSVRYITFP